MSVLTFDVGGTPITVACQRGGHAPPRKVGGDRSYSFSGAETASTRGEAMVVPVVLELLPPATVAAIRALFALGAQVPCSGDIFNKAGTIVCSASITDELHETAAWWTLSMTLYEITSVGVTAIPRVFLTNLPDDDTGTEKKAQTQVETGFGNTGEAFILDGVPLPECGTTPDPGVNCAIVYTDPDEPEVTWLTTAFLANGLLYGRPAVRVNSLGGTGDKWQTQTTRATLDVVRAGAVVFTVTTDYADGNGGFSGGTTSMQAPGATAFDALIGDRVRIKIFGRAGLHGGYTDDGDRQKIGWGYGGAGADSYAAQLDWAGLADVMDPTP